jgi:hypothetical protein
MVSNTSVTDTPSCRARVRIDVGVELRHVHLPAGEQARPASGRLRGLGHEGLHRVVHRRVAERAAVLQLQLEAAGRTQPLHRRRGEHHDERVLDAREGLVQLPGHGGAALVGLLPLVERA